MMTDEESWRLGFLRSSFFIFFWFILEFLQIFNPVLENWEVEEESECMNGASWGSWGSKIDIHWTAFGWQLKREISEHEMAREQEQPYVQEIEAEVRGLKHNIQERNKEQMALKTHFKRIKEKIDAINDKVWFHTLCWYRYIFIFFTFLL